MSPPRSLDWLALELEKLTGAELRRRRRIGSGVEAAIDFGTNDYLGLAGDPRIAAAAGEALDTWGAGASPVVCGRSPQHEALEQRLAEFEQVEAAIVFPTGFAANSGVIPALVDRGDAIYSDAKNHASLIDGCRLARAERFVYAHNDTQHLSELLAQHAGSQRRRLIVTDGLFSMDGDLARLSELGELAERYDAMLLVDEAHASGVWGPSGRGSVAWASQTDPRLESRVAVRIGTLSKAFGSFGGFVAGSQQLIDWIYNRARSYVYSTASPAAVAAASQAAIEIATAEPERRLAVQQRSAKLRQNLVEAGWDLLGSASQIVPIRYETPARALAAARRLAEAGIYAPAIRPPTVPEGESMLRLSVTYSHTENDLDRLLLALGKPDQSA